MYRVLTRKNWLIVFTSFKCLLRFVIHLNEIYIYILLPPTCKIDLCILATHLYQSFAHLGRQKLLRERNSKEFFLILGHLMSRQKTKSKETAKNWA